MLHPLVRNGPGRARAGSWDEALDRVAAGCAAIDEHGGESILPYSYAGTQGLIQGNLMSARVMNALGATDLERTICATAGMTGVGATQGISPEVDPELWPLARYVVLWGWNPMSTAPHSGSWCWRRERPGPGWWWSTRSAAAPPAWPTSTWPRCPAPTPRWRWG